MQERGNHMPDLKIGLSASATTTVCAANTAAAMKSGSLPVFATPAMCALMEEAACAAVNPCLDKGTGSVGTCLSISHMRATPVGVTVTATATLTAIADRKLTFSVVAADDRGLIGSGSHERFLINNEKFLARTVR